MNICLYQAISVAFPPPLPIVSLRGHLVVSFVILRLRQARQKLVNSSRSTLWTTGKEDWAIAMATGLKYF